MHTQPIPDMPALLATVRADATHYPANFANWLAENPLVWDAFEREALRVARVRSHYSARTIVEVLRHQTAVRQEGEGLKLDNDMTPGMARLFAHVHPEHSKLFEFRESKSAATAA